MPEDVKELIAANVRALREEAGMTQAELAAAMDIDRAYISGLERGRRNPTVVTLWHLAHALGADFHRIFLPQGSR